MIEDIDLRQEKLDEMRQDMLIEQKLRTDEDFFRDHLLKEFELRIEQLREDINNVCDLYGHDSSYWFEDLLEK